MVLLLLPTLGRWPLSMGQLHSPDINQYVLFEFRPEGYR